MAIVVLVVFRHGISSIQCLQVLGYSLPRSIAVQIKFIDLQVQFTSTGCVD